MVLAIQKHHLKAMQLIDDTVNHPGQSLPESKRTKAMRTELDRLQQELQDSILLQRTQLDELETFVSQTPELKHIAPLVSVLRANNRRINFRPVPAVDPTTQGVPSGT